MKDAYGDEVPPDWCWKYITERLRKLLSRWYEEPEDLLRVLGKEEVERLAHQAGMPNLREYFAYKKGVNDCIDDIFDLFDDWMKDPSKEWVD